jgi:hypothetical protein
MNLPWIGIALAPLVLKMTGKALCARAIKSQKRLKRGSSKNGGLRVSLVSRFAIHYQRASWVADVLNTVLGFQVPISRGLNFRWPIQGEHGLLSICGYLHQAPVSLEFCNSSADFGH